MKERIRVLRKELGLSQTEFGTKLGVNRSVIANIELDRVNLRDVLAKHICDVFKVNEQWLLHGKGEMFFEAPKRDKSVEELLTLFQELRPEFQAYVLQQIAGLRELQDIDRPT